MSLMEVELADMAVAIFVRKYEAAVFLSLDASGSSSGCSDSRFVDGFLGVVSRGSATIVTSPSTPWFEFDFLSPLRPEAEFCY